MSEDNEERCRRLAKKLRAMLVEELGEGARIKGNPVARPIIYLFGISYAHELDGLDGPHLSFLAAQAGLSGINGGKHIRDGRDLAQYVDVKGQCLMAAKHTEGRYKVTQVQNTEELEKYLNEQADWRLHSFSTGLEPANTNLPRGFGGRMAIIAVLERAHTGATLGR